MAACLRSRLSSSSSLWSPPVPLDVGRDADVELVLAVLFDALRELVLLLVVVVLAPSLSPCRRVY